MRSKSPARVAAVVLALEALGLVALAAWLIVAFARGDVDSVSSEIALIVLALVGAAAVGAFSGATWRGASWGRSGGIVIQVLVIAVGVGAATGPVAQPVVAVLLIGPALVGLVALALATRQAGARRDE